MHHTQKILPYILSICYSPPTPAPDYYYSSNRKSTDTQRVCREAARRSESIAKHSLKLTSHNHVNCCRALACLHWCTLYTVQFKNFDICSQLIYVNEGKTTTTTTANHRDAAINSKQASKHTSVCLSACLLACLPVSMCMSLFVCLFIRVCFVCVCARVPSMRLPVILFILFILLENIKYVCKRCRESLNH